MALSRERILADGYSPHLWEREAVDFIKSVLPNNHPYVLWGLVELVEPSGRRHEVDALVLGYNALYLIEIKSHPVRFAGNAVDWTLTWPDGGRQVMENPFASAGRKARVLAGMLDRELKGRRPRVEALVFLSHEKADISGLDATGRHGVVTRKTLLRAITHGEFDGAFSTLRDKTVDTPAARDTIQALRKFGIAESRGQRKLGDLVLDDVIDEGPGYQDHVAEHESLKTVRRVRVYLVPQSTTEERRDQLKRAATREARILSALSHPHVLRCYDYKAEGPTGGPCIVFEHDPSFERLDAYVRQRPELSFADRVAIVQQVGEAAAYCHQRGVLHRSIDPQSVLVRGGGDAGPIDVRLLNFQLAMHADTKGTVHLSALSEMAVYRAPEVIEDPEKAVEASDVFSLGALAYFVFVGRAPAASLAERAALLARDGRLSIVAASDALAGVQLRFKDERVRPVNSLDELIGFGTEVKLLQRCDSAADFVDLLGHVRADDEDGDGRSPSEALSGDVLVAEDKTELLVERVLGTGSTARVFRVTSADGTFALKVALDQAHDERLEAEAQLLERARGDRIVSLVRTLTIAKRVALLLQDAGTTLADLLAKDGSVGLDLAPRWGEDLLLALERLEDLGITHKDIKPANLGVSDPDKKRAQHVRLFDFSLAGAPDSEVFVGTPSYRDRFLHERGQWDAAADRFSAAMTLYEMLTSKHPTWGGADGHEIAASTDAEVTIEAERFDPTVRESLADFFRKALARDVRARHVDAGEMRRAWNAVFLPRAIAPADPSASAVAGASGDGDARADGRPARPSWTAAELGVVGDGTPVAALPLSNRAKNALDRAGLLSFGELRKVAKSKLQKLKGVGRETSSEILGFREAWRSHTGASDHGAPSRPPPSQAPSSAPSLDGEPPAPTTLRAWVDAMVPPASKGVRGRSWVNDVRAMFGYDGQPATDAQGLAARRGVSRQAVYISVGKARDYWSSRPALPALHALVREALDARAGVASLDVLADDLARVLGASPTNSLSDGDRRDARALLEIARVTDEPLADGVVHGVRWLAVERSLLDVVRELGLEADRLSARDVLPSSDDALARLRPLVAPTSLARLGVERLLPLAAEASAKSACSARLEMYPREMSAARALRLCASVFTEIELEPAKLQSIVESRYARAEPLPPRPALDDLVKAELGFVFDGGKYTRVRALAPSTSLTEAPRNEVHSGAAKVSLSAGPRAVAFADEGAREFDERLRVAAQRRSFRVIEVAAVDSSRASAAIARRLQTVERSLDRELWRALLALAEREGVERTAIVEADRAGPAGEDWETLRAFVRDAAAELLAQWSSQRGPLVVSDLGLAARYGLRAFVDGLAELARKDEGPAVFIMLARFGQDGEAPIDGGALPPLAVPNPTGAPRLVPPAAWVHELAS